MVLSTQYARDSNSTRFKRFVKLSIFSRSGNVRLYSNHIPLIVPIYIISQFWFIIFYGVFRLVVIRAVIFNVCNFFIYNGLYYIYNIKYIYNKLYYNIKYIYNKLYYNMIFIIQNITIIITIKHNFIQYKI